MNVLILGGNSPRHYDWIRQLGAYLRAQGYEVRLHDYAHWDTGEPATDIDAELGRLRQELADVTEYVIVAKSIGTVIATIGVARGVLTPARCVLLGVPKDGVAGDTPAFLPSVGDLPPTTVLQNEHDPYGSAVAVEEWLKPHANASLRFVTIPTNTTHDYLDFALITDRLVVHRA